MTLLLLAIVAGCYAPGEPADADRDGHTGANDCDDADPAVYRGAPEYCNGLDDDCDGELDDDAVDAPTWYADHDEDGYGGGTPRANCDAPSGYMADGTDCNDLSAVTYPGAPEVCDDADTDCDGIIDDGAPPLLGYPDADGDRHGDVAATPVAACPLPDGYLLEADDCDDTDGDVYPGAYDACEDTVDANCDGSLDVCEVLLQGVPEYAGAAEAEFVGNLLAGAGDVNGDGYADLLIGSWLNDAGGANAGAAYLVLGSAEPTSTRLAVTIAYTGAIVDYAGLVSGAGDVNADGYADILVGARSGAAYLILGSDTPRSTALSETIRYAGEHEDHCSGPVAGLGDVDGDGFDDFAMAGYDDGTGATYLVLGTESPVGGDLSAAIQYTGEKDFGWGGWPFRAGDVDGDGHADLLVDEPHAAYLVLGSEAPTSADLSTTIIYTDADDYVSAGAGAGDVNADGYADLLLLRGGPGYTSSVFLVPGRAVPTGDDLATALEFVPDTDGASVGAGLDGAGDVDGDSYDDFVVTDRDNDAVYLIYGSASPASSMLPVGRFYTGPDDSWTGYAAAGVGDVDGNSLDDILVGAPSADSTFEDAGTAYLVLSHGR